MPIVKVTAVGRSSAKASDGHGPVRLGLRAGTYRVRFTHERFITFEKEIVVARRHAAAEPECRSR